jgi:hypothetical protein
VQTTELDHLATDLETLAATINSRAHVLAAIAQRSSVLSQAYGHVLADQLVRVHQLCASIVLLLPAGMEFPIVVLGRALFEATTTLFYLKHHDEPETEAAILFAYTWLRDISEHESDRELTNERVLALKKLPDRVVAIASERAARHPRTWSGKSIRQMAEEAKVQGYDEAYGLISGHVHSARTGRYVRFVPSGPSQIQVEVDHDMSSEEIDVMANFARRVLRSSAGFVWEELSGESVNFVTPAPTWRRKH